MRKFNIKGKEKSGRRDSREYGRSSGRSNRRDSGRSSFEKRMHKVICDKCGQSCEVPFKPTEGKPVYCSDCFRKEGTPKSRSGYGSSRRNYRPRHESSESRQESDKHAAEFQQINAKLDKILEMLNND